MDIGGISAQQLLQMTRATAGAGHNEATERGPDRDGDSDDSGAKAVTLSRPPANRGRVIDILA